MSHLIFAQTFAIASLIAIIVGFVFWGGFICGCVWTKQNKEDIDQ